MSISYKVSDMLTSIWFKLNTFYFTKYIFLIHTSNCVNVKWIKKLYLPRYTCTVNEEAAK